MTTTTLATPATRSGGDGSRRRFARRNSLRRGTDLVIAIVLVAVVLFPIYWMVNVSLQPAARAVDTPWFPIHLDLNGYVTAIQQQGGHLVTSLIIAVGSVILSLLIATPAAYAVAQFKIKGIGIFLFAVLITQMIPGIVVANAMYTLYNQIGLLNMQRIHHAGDIQRLVLLGVAAVGMAGEAKAAQVRHHDRVRCHQGFRHRRPHVTRVAKTVQQHHGGAGATRADINLGAVERRHHHVGRRRGAGR